MVRDDSFVPPVRAEIRARSGVLDRSHLPELRRDRCHRLDRRPRAWRVADMSPARQLWVWLPFVVLFPLWFFRYSRSLWLAFERLLNPEP